jgi:hypothetical protein
VIMACCSTLPVGCKYIGLQAVMRLFRLLMRRI